MRLGHRCLPDVRKELDARNGFGPPARFGRGFASDHVPPATRVDQQGPVAIVQADAGSGEQRRDGGHVETRAGPVDLDDEEPGLLRYAGSSLRLNAKPE